MAIDRSPYRPAYIDRPEQLRRAGVSVLAERLYSELERGRWSNMAGLCWWHVDLVRVSLREHSRAKVDAALDELERAGFVSVNREVSAVFLPLEAQACAECSPNHRQGLRAIAHTFPSCAQVDLLLEIIANVEKGLPRSTKELPKPSPLRNRSKEQEQNQEQDLPVADAPAPVKPTPATKEKKPAPDVPTLEQMEEWFGEWLVDAAWQAEKCRAHWERDVFLRNGKPILNWKATCRTWAMNAIERGSRPVTGQNPAPRQQTLGSGMTDIDERIAILKGAQRD